MNYRRIMIQKENDYRKAPAVVRRILARRRRPGRRMILGRNKEPGKEEE